MRETSQSEAETVLWKRLGDEKFVGCKFLRQEPIAGYVYDFVCHECRQVIEITRDHSAADTTRDRGLNEAGYSVLRFRPNDVLDDFKGVLYSIEMSLLK